MISSAMGTKNSKRFFRRVGVTALAVTLLAGAAVPGVATGVAGQERPELREAMQSFVDSGFTGMQLRVNDERGEWVGSAGVGRLGGSSKPPTNGRFRVGSVTKTITATVVLQLVAEGRVGLDAPAVNYLPQFTLDPRITVRMLSSSPRCGAAGSCRARCWPRWTRRTRRTATAWVCSCRTVRHRLPSRRRAAAPPSSPTTAASR
ncbi:serine hydrolase domain-containing protein, partial [Actinophytocola sp.]|uniref:serine hydrolase domain-containing protein n=1 Tax=Actinophytocola sp. TaxID=1872138 RepID=UPI002ED07EF6